MLLWLLTLGLVLSKKGEKKKCVVNVDFCLLLLVNFIWMIHRAGQVFDKIMFLHKLKDNGEFVN